MELHDDRARRLKKAAGAGRRERLSAAALRERMLSTALEMVATAGGLTVSLAHLSMEEIIRLADVPRSSVYREWMTKEDFYVDLMIALVEPNDAQRTGFDTETMRLAQAAITDNADLLVTPDGRRKVFGEMIRVGVRRNFEALRSSLNYQTITALVAALPAFDADHRERVRAAVAAAERHFATQMAAFYDVVLPQLGYRTAPGFTINQVATAGSAVVEGMARRALTTPEVVLASARRPGPRGDSVEWGLPAIAFRGVIETMVELIPDWRPPHG